MWGDGMTPVKAFNTFWAFVFNFVVILMIIQLIFCWHFKKRENFGLRLLLFVPYILLFHTMLAQWGPFAPWGHFDYFPLLVYGSFNFTYVAEFLISVAIICFCFDESPWRLLSVSSAAYVVQNLGHNITELVRTALWHGDPYSSSGIGEPWYYYAVKIVIFAVCIAVSYRLLIRSYIRNSNVELDSRQRILLVVISLSLISVLNRWIYTERMRNTAIYILMITINIMLLIIQFSAFENKRALIEKQTLDQLLYLQKKQYETSIASAEIINRKCHDLKYQIAALKDMKSSTERNEVIEDLEKAVLVYDSQIKTGSDRLDIILSEKSALCESCGIEFGCMVDGTALAFMADTDLYVLLGNALDNAIEAAAKLPREDRFISLRVEKQGSMVRVSLENSCAGEVVREEDGLPATTKEDRYYHGFGVRSIKSIAEQYGGSMSIQAECGRFRLSLLFFQ